MKHTSRKIGDIMNINKIPVYIALMRFEKDAEYSVLEVSFNEKELEDICHKQKVSFNQCSVHTEFKILKKYIPVED